MIDINTLYSRYDNAGGSVSYYGYNIQNSMALQNPSDSAAAFSIKYIYYVGTVQYTLWSNNTIGAYESVWNNRSACFATPSNISVTGSSTFDGWNTSVTFNWTSSTGSSRYIANITNQNGSAIIYLSDASSSAALNPEHRTSLQFVNRNSCTLYNVATASAYTISIYPSNGFGSASTVTTTVSV